VPRFVVERFVPDISLAEAEAIVECESQQAAVLAREGNDVRILHATLVESDETILSLVEAASRADVVALVERSGVPADRVVAAVSVGRDAPVADGQEGEI
jgi:hypothetical protein